MPSQGPSVFLAGSIEQGRAVQWQAEAAERLLAERPDVLIANPRRLHWDASWPQDRDFAPFHEQVSWELDHLLGADRVLFAFDPATQSPVTLLELGLVLGRHPERTSIACPPGFWRRGNVQITAALFSVPMFDTLNEALADVLLRLPAPCGPRV